MPSLTEQILWLLLLALPVASVTRTVVFEEVFRELRQWCVRRSREAPSLLQRKCFYLFTCDYCFSHWVTLLFVILTQYKLLIPDWRGYVLAFFAVALVANVYLNLYARLRLELTSERAQIEQRQKTVQKLEQEISGDRPAGPGS